MKAQYIDATSAIFKFICVPDITTKTKLVKSIVNIHVQLFVN